MRHADDPAPNRRDLLLTGSALAAASAIAAEGPVRTAQAQPRPATPNGPANIVYFLVDNLGFGELGCYGGGILRGADTRRIDAFATEGVKLLNFASVKREPLIPAGAALSHVLARGG